MNKIKLKYQIGLFGNFESIQHTPEIVKKLMEIMQKFNSYNLLLSTVTEITIDTKTATPTQTNRISFIDNQNGFKIMFGSKRLDFIKEPRDEQGKNLGELDDYIKSVEDIITSLAEEFDDVRKFNRLSLITDCFIDDISDDDKDSIYKKLINKTFLSHQPITEWSVRIAEKQESENLKEQINNVLSIARMQGQLLINEQTKDIDEIKVMIDINTKAENKDFRFDINNIHHFLVDSLDKNNLILQEIEDKLLKD